MSYQEDRFTEIADAIRSVKGTTGTIKASEFSENIKDLAVGLVAIIPETGVTDPSAILVTSEHLAKNGNIIQSMTNGAARSVKFQVLYPIYEGHKLRIRNNHSIPLQVRELKIGGTGAGRYNSFLINTGSSRTFDLNTQIPRLYIINP